MQIKEHVHIFKQKEFALLPEIDISKGPNEMLSL